MRWEPRGDLEETMRKTKSLSHRARVYEAGLAMLAALASCGGAIEPLWGQDEPSAQSLSKFEGQTTEDYNRRLEQLHKTLEPSVPGTRLEEYRIGAEDLLDTTVFEAPELNRLVRVSASGEISLPLLGGVKAAGLTPREFEVALEELLRIYMKEPHVSVLVREMESHLVSVVGAVKKPGVFRIRGSKTILEMLSMAEGLAQDAGDTVVVMRSAGLPAAGQPSQGQQLAGGTSPPSSAKESELVGAAATSRNEQQSPAAVEINLKSLLESGDPRYNLAVYPGDIVKVTRAGIVYVVGEVHRPGGFTLRSNENITVLQALALAEGLTRTSARRRARIMRTDETTGQRAEVALDLDKILSGHAPDPLLRPKDIVFVPNSSGRSAFYRSAEAAISTISGLIIFHR